MSDYNNVNMMLKNIFSDSCYIEIICLLYERELSATEISDLLNHDKNFIENHLEALVQLNLVRKVQKNNNDFFISSNPKVCDSIISLKDALYNVVIQH